MQLDWGRANIAQASHFCHEASPASTASATPATLLDGDGVDDDDVRPPQSRARHCLI